MIDSSRLRMKRLWISNKVCLLMNNCSNNISKALLQLSTASTYNCKISVKKRQCSLINLYKWIKCWLANRPGLASSSPKFRSIMDSLNSSHWKCRLCLGRTLSSRTKCSLPFNPAELKQVKILKHQGNRCRSWERCVLDWKNILWKCKMS